MNGAALDAVLEAIELHAPVTMADVGDLRTMIAERVGDDCAIEVVLRGAPDRKYDGAHRVEFVVDGVRRALPVT